MIRRTVTALVVAALGCGLFAARDVLPAQADATAHFSNVGVAVSGGVATYYMCIVGSIAPQFAGVTVGGPGGSQYSINGLYSNQSCGPGTYAIVASISGLPAGSYSFMAAQGAMSDQTALPPALPNASFISQLGPSPDTIAQDCPTLNFTIGPDSPGIPQDCQGTGAAGSLAAIGTSPPPPTSVPSSTSTSTPAPAPTSTPVVPTSTPIVPSNPPPVVPTSTPIVPTSTPIVLTSTPPSTPTTAGASFRNSVQPTAIAATATAIAATATVSATPTESGGSIQLVGAMSNSAGAAGPALRVAALSSPVRPGDTAQFRVSYVKDALVQASFTLAGQPANSAAGITDSRGRLILSVAVPQHLNLRNGRSTVRLVTKAAAGLWHRVANFTSVVSTGSIKSIVVTVSPHALLRAVVAFPGQASLSFYGTADAHGRYPLVVKAPSKTIHGSVAAQVSIWALTAKQRAEATTTLSISDLVVSLVPGSITNCVQRSVIHVGYHPNAPLKVVALLGHNRQITFAPRTDSSGDATLQLAVTYVNADSPTLIQITASDAVLGVKRKENIAVTIPLPQACQAPGVITVGPSS